MPSTPPVSLTNWAGNIAFSPERFERPGTLEHAQEIVASAPRLRVLGSGHSFNSIADTPAVLLSLTGIEPVVEIDAEAGTVRASGWITYAALSRAVHEAGFALHNLASLPHISVAGSLATGTHGSGETNGGLGTAVAALEFIGPDGRLRTVRRGESDFDGSVVHLGALGPVTAVTLDLQPAFEMRQYVYDGLGFDDAVEHFDELAGSAYSTSMFTPWGADPAVQFWAKERVSDQTRPFPPPRRYGAVLADGPRNPVPGADPAACTEQRGRTGPWHERLPHFRFEFTPSAGDELQSEYLVGREHAREALAALRGVSEVLGPVLQISEVRTIAADEQWLSPAFGRDTVAFHFTWVRDYESVEPAIRVLEEALAPFDVRPHWGKLFTIPIAEVRSQYPRMGDFEELRNRVDPEEKFGNDFCSSALGGITRLRVVPDDPEGRALPRRSMRAFRWLLNALGLPCECKATRIRRARNRARDAGFQRRVRRPAVLRADALRAVVFLAVALPADLRVAFLAVAFLVPALLAAVFLAGAVATERLRVEAALEVFFAAFLAVFFAAAFLAALLRAVDSRGNFRFPVTSSLKPVPGRNAGITVFLTRTASPVRGLRAMRAAR